MKQLTDLEKVKMTHFMRLMGTRVIPTYFYSENKKQYLAWQGNACRQTAMFVAHYLDAAFLGSNVRLLEGTFHIDASKHTYEHAYVFLQIHPDDKTGLLVDVATVQFPTVVDFEYPVDQVGEYGNYIARMNGINLQQVQCVDIPWKSMLFDSEYYTRKEYWKVFKELMYDASKYLSSSVNDVELETQEDGR